MKENNNKQLAFLCGFRALAAYAVLSFFWLAFISISIKEGSQTDVNFLAERLVISNGALAVFSVAYGFSLFILRNEKLSGTAKRSLHMLVNYLASMFCVYAMFSNVSGDPNVKPKTWIVAMLLATVVFLIIYGIITLVINILKKKFR